MTGKNVIQVKGKNVIQVTGKKDMANFALILFCIAENGCSEINLTSPHGNRFIDIAHVFLK